MADGEPNIKTIKKSLNESFNKILFPIKIESNFNCKLKFKSFKYRSNNNFKIKLKLISKFSSKVKLELIFDYPFSIMATLKHAKFERTAS